MKEKIHIGAIIKSIAEKKNMKEVQLAKLINRHYSDIPKIFKRESISTDLLLSISVALQYDFFTEVYGEYLNNTLQNSAKKNNNE